MTAWYAARRAVMATIEADTEDTSSPIHGVSVDYSRPKRDLDGEHIWTQERNEVEVSSAQTIKRSMMWKEEGELVLVVRVRKSSDPLGDQEDLDTRCGAIVARILYLIANLPDPVQTEVGRTDRVWATGFVHAGRNEQARCELTLRVSSSMSHEVV